MWSNGHLLNLRGSEWVTYPVDPSLEFGNERTSWNESWEITSKKSPRRKTNVAIAPLDKTHVLILVPDRILEFDAERRRARTAMAASSTGIGWFLGMRAARDGKIYISGHGGIGRLAGKAGRDWRWETAVRPPAAYSDFSEPFDGPDGALFTTGITSSQETAALSFDGRRWREMYRGTSRIMRAWPGTEGSVWVQDGNHLFEMSGARKNPVPARETLSGILIGVTPENDGRFWVTSSQGLAHYMPPGWRTPAEAREIDDVVNNIAEDRSGNLWFLGVHALFRFDNAKWSSFPLPKGESPWEIFTNGLAALPDGTLAIRTTSKDLLIFDPSRKDFSMVKHPQGQPRP